jgi:glutathione S-transferase/RNA polymerase-associated protein
MRANERPSVAACVDSVRAVVKAMPDLGALVASGKFKRQYRDHRLEWMLRSGGLPIVLEGIEKQTIRFGNKIG